MAPRIGSFGGQGGRFGALALAFVFSAGSGVMGLAMTPTTAAAQSASVQTRLKKSAQAKPRQPAPAGASAKTHQKPEPKGFMETIMEGPKLTTTPPEAADWVRATRRDPNAPRRAARAPGPGRAVLTSDEIRAREAQLDKLRASHDRIAGRKPPTGKFGSAAGKPQTAEAEKYKPGCVLTCSNPITVPRTQRR